MRPLRSFPRMATEATRALVFRSGRRTGERQREAGHAVRSLHRRLEHGISLLLAAGTLLVGWGRPQPRPGRHW
jgi:hypothetical protein